MEERQLSEEERIISLILNGGNARSLALKAIDKAQNDEFDDAWSLMKEANDAIKKAHNSQTDFIQEEINLGEKSSVTLLMVHAQDHMMNALTMIDLAEKFIQMYERQSKS